MKNTTRTINLQMLLLLSIIISCLVILPSSVAMRQLNAPADCSQPPSDTKTACLNNVGNVNAARTICGKVNILTRAQYGVIPSDEQLQSARAFCQSSIFDLANCYCGPNCDPKGNAMFDMDLTLWGLTQTFINSMAYITSLVEANPATSSSVKLPATVAPDIYVLVRLYPLNYAFSPGCYVTPGAATAPISLTDNPDCTPIYVGTADCHPVSTGEIVYDPISQDQILPGGARGCSDTPVALSDTKNLIDVPNSLVCPTFYCTQNPITDTSGKQIGVRCATPCYKSADEAQLCCPGTYVDPTKPNVGYWTGTNTPTPTIPPACSNFCNNKVCHSCALTPDTSGCPQVTPVPTPTPDPTTPKKNDCPHIYSLTASGAKFEESSLELQFSSVMDKPYYTRLDNYDPTLGQIIVSEPFKETTYLSNIQLIGVKHQGTALITGEGQIVTIRDPQVIACIAKDGSDCTELVRNKDSLYIKPISTLPGEVISPVSYGKTAYSTGLKNVNLQDSSTYTDYIELTLPETESSYAKLVVDYSMNPKIALFEPRVVQDHNKILPVIYAVLENPQIGKYVDEEMLQRIGFAKLYVLDKSGEWQEYDTKGLISYTEKEEAIQLDLSKIPGNKIRIMFTAGLFAFDRIAVDYTQDEISKTTYYEPNNILGNKRISENEQVIATFDTADSTDTTYFLKLDGYYRPGINSEEELRSGNISLDLVQLWKAIRLLLDNSYSEKYILEILLE